MVTCVEHDAFLSRGENRRPSEMPAMTVLFRGKDIEAARL